MINLRLLLITIFFASCTEVKNQQLTFKDVFNSIGVLSLDNTGNFYKTEDLVIFNDDGSQYAKLSIKNKVFIIDKDTINLYERDFDPMIQNEYSFNPKLFYFELGGLIQFEVTKINGDSIFIYTNKEKEIIKWVNKTSGFDFSVWENHIKTAFITFNKTKNPIRKEPNQSSQTVVYDTNKDYDFFVIDFKDDWIKIECETACNSCDDSITGWIKWQENKKLLISLFYAC